MLPRVIAFDLDSTLAVSKSPVTKEMGELLTRLLAVRTVAIMSGGKYGQFEKQVLTALPTNANLSNLYLFPVCAGYCYHFEEGSWKMIDDNSLTDAEKSKVMRALAEAMAETGFTEPPAHVWGERIEDRGALIAFSALGQEAPTDAKKAWDPDKKKRRPLAEALIKRLPDFEVKMNAMTTIDITRKGITKAYGIRKLSEFTATPISDMVYIGDALFPGGNDEVVKETGVVTREISGPDETMQVIKELLENSSPLKEKLTKDLKGDVTDSADERAKYSHDTSVFERTPSLVVYPKDAADVSNLVKAVADAKKAGENVSVTARSAGTDMSGGPLTTSVVAVFTKYMNKVLEVGEGYAVAEPGSYYRDFEKATLQKGYLLPSYPASRNIAALGGMVANNAGGERTLEYGKTERYVRELEVVLSDGSQATFKELGPDELDEKKSQQNLEGEIYRRMSELVVKNREALAAARPKVSKNSAGYALWDIFDTERGTFDLTKLITGSQGTLALVTKMKLALVKPQPYRSMLVIFLKDFDVLPEIVRRVLALNPESFESYDDHTFKLAMKLLPQLLAQMGLARAMRLGFSFLPEVGLVLSGGVPKLVLMAEFSEDTAAEALAKAHEAKKALEGLPVTTRVARNERAAEKFWVVRREAFALLRKKLPGLTAAPFIDDFVVPPASYPEFLPELFSMLDSYGFIYAVTGHIGDGNFHIFPLLDMSKDESHTLILELSPKVYDLVIKHGGTTTGEHNDGIIRTPYLTQLFGEEMVRLFRETKHIFDPAAIFNPGKKVGGTFEDIERGMVHHST